MDYSEVEKKLDDKLSEFKRNYVIQCIDCNLYRAFVKHYDYFIENEEIDELIINYIHRNISNVVNDSESIDKEWMDYYNVFITGIQYEFKIIHTKAFADLIYRRIQTLMLKITEGASYEDAFDSELNYNNENYEPYDDVVSLSNISFETWNSMLFVRCTEVVKSFTSVFFDELNAVGRGMDLKNGLDGLIDTVTSAFDPDFSAQLMAPQSGIVVDHDDKIFLCVPNLIQCVKEILYDSISQTPVQNNFVIVNEEGYSEND